MKLEQPTCSTSMTNYKKVDERTLTKSAVYQNSEQLVSLIFFGILVSYINYDILHFSILHLSDNAMSMQ